MAQNNLAQMVDDATVGEAGLFAFVNSRTEIEDPEIRSMLWLLREGVIGRSHFEDVVGGDLGDRLQRAAG